MKNNQNMAAKPKKKKKGLIIALIIFVVIALAVLAFYVIGKYNPFGRHVDNMFKKIDKKYESVTFDEDSGMLYMNNQVIVILSETADDGDIDRICKKFDAEADSEMADMGMYCLTLDESLDMKDMEKLVEKIKNYDTEAVADVFINPVIVSEASAPVPEIETEPSPEATPELTEETETEPEATPEPTPTPKPTEKPIDLDREPEYPDDPWENASWDVDVPRDANWGVEAIRAPYAWAYFDELKTVKVGLIDAVVNTSHSDVRFEEAFRTYTDLDSNMQRTEDISTSSSEGGSHGTHVAGTMAATWNNEGVSGILGDKAKLYYSTGASISEKGAVDLSSTYDFIRAIKALLNEDVQVINISMGYIDEITFAASRGNEKAVNFIDTQTAIAETMLCRIIDEIEENNAPDFVICVAAGNGNSTRFYEDSSATYGYTRAGINSGWFHTIEWGGVQANDSLMLAHATDTRIRDRIIVVGAAGVHDNSTSENTHYRYANFSNIGERVDVVAPGEGIYSAIDGGCGYMSGTSMASPHVAGVAGLIFAANPSLSGPEVKGIITGTADDIIFQYQGGTSGMVDAEASVKAALESRSKNIATIVPGTGGGLDICFIVDTTGSMGDDIANAKENMISILDEMEEKDPDFRVALIDYRDFPERTSNSKDYPAKVDLQFTKDRDAIVNAINALDLGNGGDSKETVYSGIHEALSLNWRYRAQKILIILGDAEPLDPEPTTGYTYDAVLESLYLADIGIDLSRSDERVLGSPDESSMHVYTINISGSSEFFKDIAAATGGVSTSTGSADEVSGAIIDSIQQIEATPIIETEIKFGEEFAKETVEFYTDGEFVYEIKLDDKGNYILHHQDYEEYDWEISRLKRTGVVELEEDKSSIKAEVDDAKWYNFAIVLWQKHRVETIVVTSVSVVLIVLILVLTHIIKKKIRKSKEKKAEKERMIPRCPKCGTPMTGEGEFCTSCGYNKKTPKQAFCINCGAPITEGSTFCGKCGQAIQK